MTTHTQCSDSDYDGEALDTIHACDASTVVKGDGNFMDNQLIYEKYIRHLSTAHQKLFAIIREHPEPDFFPPRAFPNHWSNQPISAAMWALYCSLILIAMFSAYRLTRSCCCFGRDTNRAKQVQPASEYQPLIKAGRISLS